MSKMKKAIRPAIGIGASLLLYGVVAWNKGDIVVNADPGGDVAALYAQYYAQWRDGGRHVIDGRCASACTMRLAFDNTCATPNAKLGFHKAYYVNFFGLKIGSTWGTGYMLERYPDSVRAWLDRQGGITHTMKWLEGKELAAVVPRC